MLREIVDLLLLHWYRIEMRAANGSTPLVPGQLHSGRGGD